MDRGEGGPTSEHGLSGMFRRLPSRPGREGQVGGFRPPRGKIEGKGWSCKDVEFELSRDDELYCKFTVELREGHKPTCTANATIEYQYNPDKKEWTRRETIKLEAFGEYKYKKKNEKEGTRGKKKKKRGGEEWDYMGLSESEVEPAIKEELLGIAGLIARGFEPQLIQIGIFLERRGEEKAIPISLRIGDRRI